MKKTSTIAISTGSPKNLSDAIAQVKEIKGKVIDSFSALHKLDLKGPAFALTIVRQLGTEQFRKTLKPIQKGAEQHLAKLEETDEHFKDKRWCLVVLLAEIQVVETLYDSLLLSITARTEAE